MKFKNSQNRWIFGVNSWKLRKKFLALILENYAWGQFLPCLTNSMSVHIKILLYQYNLVYLQFIRQKYHEKDHFLGHFPYIDNDNDLLSLYSFQKLLGRVSFSFKVCLIDQMRFGQQMYCWQPFYTTWNKKKQGISRKKQELHTITIEKSPFWTILWRKKIGNFLLWGWGVPPISAKLFFFFGKMMIC